MTSPQAPPHELRLALAMRGGVSLSVWIGGSCAEVDQLRTAAPTATGGFWDRLVDEAGYDSVAVDILAGASAGGLNGVIYAASQQFGFSMGQLREVWVKVGDTEKLLRTKAESNTYWPSLFKGDEYFFTQARTLLKQLCDEAPEASRARTAPSPILLTLSATLVEPIRRVVNSPQDELLSNLRFASGFVFRHPHHAWQHSDFSPSDGLSDRVADQLALAARSTSSFPVAFEAANVLSFRRDSFTAEDGRDGDKLLVDMAGVFQDRSNVDVDDCGFLVSDGGILDNIPLGRALQGIADASAEGPTDRYLLYIHPGAVSLSPTTGSKPGRTSGPRPGLTRRRDPVSVLQGLLGARVPSEDIVGDMRQLDDYNVGVERAGSLRRLGFTGLETQDDLIEAARAAWPGYRMFRADEDQRLISTLLDDPIRVLAEDPFPSHVGGEPVDDDVWRSPLDAVRTPDGQPVITRQELAAALTDSFLTRLPQSVPAGQPPTLPPVAQVGSLPLLRICRLLIEWAQSLEQGPETIAGFDEASSYKAQAYRAAAFVRDAIDRPRRLGWVVLAATAPENADGQRLASAAASLSSLALTTPDCARAIVEALEADGSDPSATATLADAVQERIGLLDWVPTWAWKLPKPSSPPAQPAEATVDLREAVLTQLLLPLARRLAELAAQQPTVEPTKPSDYLNRVLRGDITRTTLEALEIVTFPEFASGLPGRRAIRFRRLSAGSPTPLAPYFTDLLAIAAKHGLWWDSEQTDPRSQEGLHLTLKLAGNELANFSAFLRPQWRTNDWLWGRLDAVPTLVDLLLSADGFRLVAPTEATVRQLVSGPSGSPLRPFLDKHVSTDDVVQQIRRELGDSSGKESPTLRRSLIEARQWEILTEELGVSSKGLVDAVGGYTVGAETIGDPELSDEITQRLDAIADVVGNVTLSTLQGRFGAPKEGGLKAWGTNKAVDAVTRALFRRTQRKSRTPRISQANQRAADLTKLNQRKANRSG